MKTSAAAIGMRGGSGLSAYVRLKYFLLYQHERKLTLPAAADTVTATATAAAGATSANGCGNEGHMFVCVLWQRWC